MMTKVQRLFTGLFTLGLLWTISVSQIYAVGYGEGAYGVCNYGEGCNISMTTSGTVNLSVTPTSGGVYTIAKDTVTVTTNTADGYTLALESSSATENTLAGTTATVAATTGTPASPTSLSVNQWGFRLDGFSGFGAGPTSAISNQSSSSLTFARVPLLGSADTIKTTSSAALTGDTTDVWYGVRVDLAIPADTYTRTVTYTATAL